MPQFTEMDWPNYTVLTAATPAAIAPGPCTIHRIITTATVTGSVTLSDSLTTASGTPLLFSVATPAAGSSIELNIRCKQGAWVSPGSAGTIVVIWR